MNVQLRVTVLDVGKDGEVVSVDDEQAKWLTENGYATEVSEDAPS